VVVVVVVDVQGLVVTVHLNVTLNGPDVVVVVATTNVDLVLILVMMGAVILQVEVTIVVTTMVTAQTAMSV
jgi:hypothetical protein